MAGDFFDGYFQNLKILAKLQVHDIEITPEGIATSILGLHPQWNHNFGNISAEPAVNNKLTHGTTALK